MSRFREKKSPRIFAHLLFLFVWTEIARDEAFASSPIEDKEILSSTLKNYDPDFRPIGTTDQGFNSTGPTIVTVNFYVRSISDVDTKSREMKVQLTLRMQWLDSRLAYSSNDSRFINVPKSKRHLMWFPDIFFTNEKSGHFHDMLDRNEYFRIFPNGEVHYSTRVSLTLDCPMYLKQFPFDIQTCALRLASYASTQNDIILKWKATGDLAQVAYSDLFKPNYNLALQQFITDYCDVYTTTGAYSCLKVDLLFKRESVSHWYHFLGSFVAIIVTWLSSFINPRKFPVPRILILLSTTGYILISTRESLDQVQMISYMTIMHYWNLFIWIFVIWAILEFIIVVVLLPNSKTKDREGEIHEIEQERFFDKLRLTSIKARIKNLKFHDYVEILHRIIFIIAFALLAFVLFAKG